MLDTDKFIGIPHVFNGHDFDGCDCIGLCRLFYKEQGWPQRFWDNKEAITEENKSDKENWLRLYKYLGRHFKRVRKPEEMEDGGVVVFNINGDLHLGIYAGRGNILAMEVPVIYGKTRSTLYHSDMWQRAFVRGYNRKCKHSQ